MALKHVSTTMGAWGSMAWGDVGAMAWALEGGPDLGTEQAETSRKTSDAINKKHPSAISRILQPDYSLVLTTVLM